MRDSYIVRKPKVRLPKTREEILFEIAQEKKKPLVPPTIHKYRKQLVFPQPELNDEDTHE